MLIAAIGDTHFRVDNISIVDILIKELLKNLKEKSPDIIILLGDILHDHERLHTIALNRAYHLIKELRKIAPVYVIVGNHDMINHEQFLTDQHWMNAMKLWENVTIVDQVIHLEKNECNFMLCPYVAPGRFIEALETNDGYSWRDCDILFAHQEFKGCKMGAMISEIGDEWDIDWPQVVSGHIHKKQIPQDNIFYTGSSMQVAYGETDDNIILMIDIDEAGIEFEEIELKIPRKRIIYIESSQFDSFKIPETIDQIKVTIKGSYEDFKNLKKSNKYKEMIKNGFKISYKHSKIEEKANVTQHDTVDFDQILKKLIEEETNDFVTNAYKKITSNK